MASSSRSNSNRRSKDTLGHDNQGQRIHEDRRAAPAPAPSLRQWAGGFFARGPPDWLSPSSCSGCLTQVDDRGADGENVDDAVDFPSRDRGRFSLLDHDESTASPVRDSNRLIPSAIAESTDDAIHKSAKTTDSSYHVEEGVGFTKVQRTHSAVPAFSGSHVHPFNKYERGLKTRLRNRSSAPKQVCRTRIIDLIETVEAMVPPSMTRAQGLAVRGQVATQNFTSSASLIDDTLSGGSSSSVEVHIMQALSSTISPPFDRSSSASPTADAKSNAILVTPSRSRSLERLESPQVNRLMTPNELRRTQSLKPPFSPPQLESKKASPRSILDLTYSFGGQSSDDEKDSQRTKKSTAKQAHTPWRRGSKDKGSKLFLEGINFTDGEGGFLSDTIDLDWCCYDITTKDSVDIPSNTFREATNEDCGGYVDYSGVYHPCTNLEKEQRGDQSGEDQGMDLKVPCQGCIFRRGTYDGRNGNGDDEEEEELYYDSDPGQHFAIKSWSLYQKLQSPTRSQNAADNGHGPLQLSVGTSSSTSGQHAKLAWRRRKKRRSKSNRDRKSASSSLDSSHINEAITPIRGPRPIKHGEDIQRRQEDQQAYLYDYFSQNDHGSGSAMRTGFCSTKEIDVGNNVQEALNSKWRLLWHVNIINSPNSSNLNHMPPIVCDLWIERGYRRNRTEIVEPKLMWSQPNLHKKHHLRGSITCPYRVSLFAIRRLFQVATREDWEKMNEGRQTLTPPMPIARPDSLLVVRSSLGEDYLFEAPCSRERDRIMHLLKMTTARLVSHAVVGNGDLMIQEFFNEEFVAGGINASSLVSTTDGD